MTGTPIVSTRSGLAIKSASVFPDFSGLDSTGLGAVVGALLTIVLVTAVLMLIVSAVAWALAAAHGNHQAAAKARTGVWVAVGATVLAGAGVAWLNFLLDLGTHL